MKWGFTFMLLSPFFLASQINCQEGILHISSRSEYKQFCIVYNQSWTPISRTLDNATSLPLVNLTSTLLCNESGVDPDKVKDKAVVVMRGECDFSQKARAAAKLGAKALLIASTRPLIIPSANNSEYSKVKIPLALMKYMDLSDVVQSFGDKMEMRLYAPSYSKIDPSILVIFAIAVITVALGGYWSGTCERDRLEGTVVGGGDESKAENPELILYSPLKVVIFVVLMCGMLVLMFFFYNVLVYVIIAIFCFASASAMFSCIDAILDKISCWRCNFSVRSKSFSVRSILLTAMCITISVLWGVYRNEERWIWILQDILGMAFCLNFLKTISMSNFKICVILLSLLLVYDIFFVFITPFFTKNGVSIMVQVALGPDAVGDKAQGRLEIPAEPQAPSEKLPVVMRVPWFSAWALNLCWMQFSILGYGDIIVPGLLVAYCSRFDVWVSSRWKIYFTSSCIAYALGLVVTFAAMLLSEMGQPALLYLVPFTVITCAVVAKCRGELKQFWTGTPYQREDLAGV